MWLRVDFWDQVKLKLDRLKLPLRDRERVEELIGRVVARVPEKEATEFKKARREYQEKRAQLFRMLGVVRLLRS